MNHDYAHCLDYTPDCPKECFRAQLQRDLDERRSEFIGVPLTCSHLGGTVECKLANRKKMSDLIERQSAIDALNDEFTISGKTNAIAVQDYIRRVYNRLCDLPSAPERMCHGCVHEKHGSVVCDNCSRLFLDRYEVDNNG